MVFKKTMASLILLLPLSLFATTYSVKKNDTMMTISNSVYGTHQCWALILEGNPNINDANSLEVGQRLLIPNEQKCTKKKSRVLSNSEGIVILRLDKSSGIQKIRKKIVKQKKNRPSTRRKMPNKIVSRKDVLDLNSGYFSETNRDDFFIYEKNQRVSKGLPLNKSGLTASTEKEKKNQRSKFVIQLASFNNEMEANSNHGKISIDFPRSFVRKVNVKGEEWFRLLLGPFNNKNDASLFVRNSTIKNYYANFFIKECQQQNCL